MTHYCPACGQRVLLRLGAMLTDREAEIFDLIKRQSKYGGIRSDALINGGGGRKVVAVHVCNINKKLAKQGWRIVCQREGSAKGFYRVVKQEHNYGIRPVGTVMVDNGARRATKDPVGQPGKWIGDLPRHRGDES